MSNFTIKRSLFLVPTLYMVKEFEKIDKFMIILEKSNVSDIINNVKRKEEKCKGRIGYNPYNLFAAIIYCFAKFKGTLRDIEDKCKYDIRLYYIMEGNIPKHSIIGSFINDYILPFQYEIFTLINKQIIKELNLNIDDNYIDGTKLEANANKYKFVWKPTKYHQKLDEKIKKFVMDIGYNMKFNNDELITTVEFNRILKDYVVQENINIYDIPSGIGTRRTLVQKNYLLGFKYLTKLLEYEEKENICGENRNSYYKTDKDATAMVLKKDYYSKLSHDFHAGYNIQIIVSNLLVLMYGVFQNRDDHHTFIPMNDKYKEYYGFYPKNECADSGYGIQKNYEYIKKNKIGNYVKYQSWNGESSGKNPRLFKVDEKGKVICLNSRIGKEYDSNTHSKSKGSKYYKFYGCKNCRYSYKCKKNLNDINKDKNYRVKEISIEYELYKDKAKENLLSPKGIEIRINRSIQVEGTFGQLKQNMNYDRIRRRGIDKVSCEIMLTFLGANVRRLLESYDKNIIKDKYWKKTESLQSEIFPDVKPK